MKTIPSLITKEEAGELLLERAISQNLLGFDLTPCCIVLTFTSVDPEVKATTEYGCGYCTDQLKSLDGSMVWTVVTEPGMYMQTKVKPMESFEGDEGLVNVFFFHYAAIDNGGPFRAVEVMK